MSGETPPKIIPIEVRPETVGRYTGLRDKINRKIFEGDILQFRKTVNILDSGSFFPKKMKAVPEKAAIVYAEMFARFCFLDSDTPFDKMTVKEFKMVIIGNVYDDPELLDTNVVIPIEED